jgi:type IV pilus assembly protein PilV
LRLRSPGCRGFTLTELLIAITVLSVGLLAVASMQGVAITNGSASHRMMVATELAKEAMEDIMAWEPGDARLNASAADASYAANVSITGGGTFNITYTTTVNTPLTGTTRVDVSVSENLVHRPGSGIRPINTVRISGFRKVL